MKLAKLILAGAMLATVPSIALAQQSSEGTVSMINRLSGTIAIKQTQNGTVGAGGGGATEQQFAAPARLDGGGRHGFSHFGLLHTGRIALREIIP